MWLWGDTGRLAEGVWPPQACAAAAAPHGGLPAVAAPASPAGALAGTRTSTCHDAKLAPLPIPLALLCDADSTLRRRRRSCEAAGAIFPSPRPEAPTLSAPGRSSTLTATALPKYIPR